MLNWLVEWWMRRCTHDDRDVAADILEGEWDQGRVCYCRRCGAVQILPPASREWEIDQAVRALIRKLVAGTITPAERQEMEALQRERAHRMRFPLKLRG